MHMCSNRNFRFELYLDLEAKTMATGWPWTPCRRAAVTAGKISRAGFLVLLANPQSAFSNRKGGVIRRALTMEHG
jgi:hypothetical protein